MGFIMVPPPMIEWSPLLPDDMFEYCILTHAYVYDLIRWRSVSTFWNTHIWKFITDLEVGRELTAPVRCNGNNVPIQTLENVTQLRRLVIYSPILYMSPDRLRNLSTLETLCIHGNIDPFLKSLMTIPLPHLHELRIDTSIYSEQMLQFVSSRSGLTTLYTGGFRINETKFYSNIKK